MVRPAGDRVHGVQTIDRGRNVQYTYKVCEAGTATCSNKVTVRF
jgi:hypothetical protein